MMAGLAGFGDARLVGINFVERAVLRRGEVGHHHVGAAFQSQLPPLAAVQRGQGRGGGDVRPRTDQPRQGNHFVGHRLAGRHLLGRPGRRARRRGRPAASRDGAGTARRRSCPGSAGRTARCRRPGRRRSGRGCRSSRRCPPRSPAGGACRGSSAARVRNSRGLTAPGMCVTRAVPLRGLLAPGYCLFTMSARGG